MIRKSVTTICFLFVSLFLLAQKKTLLKFEFPVGMMTEPTFTPEAQKISIMYPTVYIPLHKHLDIGASYTTQKFNYYVSEQNPVDFTYKYYTGNIKYKVTSLYLKINLSASQKRVNPFFSYVLSFSKGTYTGPTIDTTSKFYLNNTSFGNASYDQYSDNKFVYEGRMTPQEEAALKKVLDKSQLSHGVQIGVDYKILPFLNLFVKLAAFSVLGYDNPTKSERAFSYSYKDEYKDYKVSPMEYYMFGIILKIDGGKKSLIK